MDVGVSGYAESSCFSLRVSWGEEETTRVGGKDIQRTTFLSPKPIPTLHHIHPSSHHPSNSPTQKPEKAKKDQKQHHSTPTRTSQPTPTPRATHHISTHQFSSPHHLRQPLALDPSSTSAEGSGLPGFIRADKLRLVRKVCQCNLVKAWAFQHRTKE